MVIGAGAAAATTGVAAITMGCVSAVVAMAPCGYLGSCDRSMIQCTQAGTVQDHAVSAAYYRPVGTIYGYYWNYREKFDALSASVR